MIRRSVVLAAALLAFLPMRGSAEKANQEAKAASAVPATTDDVVVKVLGESITEKQVLSKINEIAQQLQQQATPQQLQQKDIVFYKDALETLIGGILLKSEGKEKNIVADKAKVDQTFQSVKGQFPTEEAFQKAMANQGVKEADVRNAIEEGIVIQQVLDLTFKNIPAVSDADIQKFYNENPKYFDEPEQVHAAHIYMRVDKNATPEQKAEIRKKLEAIRADIESKKISFAEAAAKNSDDKENAQTGGDLGTFKRGENVIPAIENAAFSAKPGTLTPIVETEFGFHLINVIEYKPGGKKPLEKAQPDIKNFLERKAKQEATQKHVDELKAKAKIETVMTGEEWNKRHTAK
ncbi:MAG: peptidylprolyl isomerase [Acidobacteriota bacterium]|jgi:peptidyl-prolyl cis-trans isomerase C